MLVNLVSKFGLVNPKKKVNFGESKFTSFGASGYLHFFRHGGQVREMSTDRITFGHGKYLRQ